jgi:hypothetical protein
MAAAANTGTAAATMPPLLQNDEGGVQSRANAMRARRGEMATLLEEKMMEMLADDFAASSATSQRTIRAEVKQLQDDIAMVDITLRLLAHGEEAPLLARGGAVHGFDRAISPNSVNNNVHTTTNPYKQSSGGRALPKDIVVFDMGHSDPNRRDRVSIRAPRRFTQEFERIGRGNGVPEEQFVAGVLACTTAINAERMASLIADFESEKGRGITWTEFKVLFYAHFEDPLQRDIDQREFESLIASPNVAITTFTDLYLQYLGKLGLPSNSSQYSQHLIQRLPAWLQSEIRMIRVATNTLAAAQATPVSAAREEHLGNNGEMTVLQIIKLARTLESNRNFAASSSSNFGGKKHAQDDGGQSNSNKPRQDSTGRQSYGHQSSPKSTFYCERHGADKGHNTKDCKSLLHEAAGRNSRAVTGATNSHSSPRTQSTPGNRGTEKRGPSKESPCNICGDPGHWAPNCPKKGMSSTTTSSINNKTPSAISHKFIQLLAEDKVELDISKYYEMPSGREIEYVNVHYDQQTLDITGADEWHDLAQVEFDEELESVNNVQLFATGDQDSPLLVTLKIQGHLVQAMWDSGASHSIIHTAMAETMQLTTTPVAGKVMLGSKNMMTDRIGRTQLVTIEYGGIPHQGIPFVKFDTTLEVMVLPPPFHVIVGRDLMGKLGIGVTGLCSAPPIEPGIGDKDVLDQDELERNSESHVNNTTIREKDLARMGITKLEYDEFMMAIQPEIDKNNSIPDTAFCTHPLAVTRIKLLEGTRPWHHRQRPIPTAMWPKYLETIKEMLEQGLIVEAPPETPYNNRTVPVMKSNGKVRLAIDLRHLNTVLDEERLLVTPNIDDILERVKGRFLSKFDEAQCFYRMPLESLRDQELTAFTVGKKRYMATGLPNGIKDGTARAQAVKLALFADIDDAEPYVDDTVAFSNDLKSHTKKVIAILRRYNQFNIKLNLDKCVWLAPELEFLGRVVSKDGVKVAAEKVAGINDFPLPTTGKQVQSLLGATNFLREHIVGYAQITAALDDLRNLDKVTQEDWTETKLKAFSNIKQAFADAIHLAHYDENLPISVATDASTRGIAAVLYQGTLDENGAGTRRIISCVSRSLSKSERNYSATKLEMLAIIFALQRFHYYLYCQPKFQLFTDHRALTFLYTQERSNHMLDAWVDLLTQYSMEIVHLPGIENVLPDALSRVYCDAKREAPLLVDKFTSQSTHSENSKVQAMPSQIVAETASSSEGLASAQSDYAESEAGDPDVKRIVDVEQQRQLIDQAHSFGHAGVEGTMKRLKAMNVQWTGMHEMVGNHCKSCLPCLRYNVSRKTFEELRHTKLDPEVLYPGEALAIDTKVGMPTTEDGNTCFFVITDIATGYRTSRAAPTASANEAAKFLLDYMCSEGLHKYIVSDNGSEYKNDTVRMLLASLGVGHRFTAEYHPQANGQAENSVKVVTNLVAKMIDMNTHSWDKSLSTIMLAINTKQQYVRGYSPFQLFRGRQFLKPVDFNAADLALNESEQKLLMQRRVQLDRVTQVTDPSVEIKHILDRNEFLRSVVHPSSRERVDEFAKKAVQAFANRNKIIDPYPLHSIVMVAHNGMQASLEPRYEGPYMVIHRSLGGAYNLLSRTGEVLERRFTPSQLKLTSIKRRDFFGTGPLEHDVTVAESEYVVEHILQHKRDPSKPEDPHALLYLVKWRGYSETENTWEPASNFETNPGILVKYHKQVHISTARDAGKTLAPSVTAGTSNKDVNTYAKAYNTTSARRQRPDRGDLDPS